MVGYLMALYSDYKGGRGGGGGGGAGGGQTEGGRGQEQKENLMMELLKLLSQLFLHVKEGNRE